MLGTQIVEHLKRFYSHPAAADDDDAQPGYCVGGAICLAVGALRHAAMPSALYPAFPTEDQLTRILCEFNPALAGYRDTAEKAAIKIISYNDEEKFDKAWGELEKVLNWATREQMVLDQQEEAPKPVPTKITPRRQRLRAESQREISVRRRAFEERGIRIRFWGQMRKAARRQ